MPLGVALVIGAVLAVHLLGQIAGPDAWYAFQSQNGIVPARIDSQIEGGNFLSPLGAMLTSQFLHSGTLHLVMNLAMLLQAGPIAEFGLNKNKDEAVRFIIFFLLCGIISGMTFYWMNPGSMAVALGASGAISGVFAGFLWAVVGSAPPGQPILRPVLSSGIVFLVINVGLAWIARVTNFLPIAWECHLGGFVGGLILYPLFAKLGRSRPHAPHPLP